MTRHPDGVLPDDVSRDPRSNSWLIFIDFATGAAIQDWLQNRLTRAVMELTGTDEAVATVAVGHSFFTKVERLDAAPHGFAEPLPGEVQSDQHDLAVYVFSRSDAAVAKLLRDITAGQAAVITAVKVERGYQRVDKREVFGQRDGVRNVNSADRRQVVFVPLNSDEPAWAHGGTYLTYLKIQQNVEQWPTDLAQQAAIIGRNIEGQRVDTPTVTDVADEGEFADLATPPVNSHVRKTGPRGAENDAVQIFRRGTPYVEIVGDKVTEGLLFVSYQAEIDAFVTVFRRWMQNQNFPTVGAGADALTPYISILGGGVYFAIPNDLYIGAGIFAPATGDGTLVIRVRVLDASNAPDPDAALAAAAFTISGSGVSESVTTDAAGRVVVTGLPAGVTLTITEQAPPAGAAPNVAPQTVTLERCVRSTITFDHVRNPSAPPNGYGAS